jgi:hypothetical protein
MASSLDQLWCTLITGNHILDYFSLVTGYGHMSARNPLTNSTFFFDPVDPSSLIPRMLDISNGTSPMELISATDLFPCHPARNYGFTKPSTRDIPTPIALSTAIPERSCHLRISTSLSFLSSISKPCLVFRFQSSISLITTPLTSRSISWSSSRIWVQHWQIHSPRLRIMQPSRTIYQIIWLYCKGRMDSRPRRRASNTQYGLLGPRRTRRMKPVTT